jgi:hypothetical protein
MVFFAHLQKPKPNPFIHRKSLKYLDPDLQLACTILYITLGSNQRRRPMSNITKAQAITRHFGVLQGLKSIPFGLLMLIIAFRNLGGTGLGDGGDCTFTAIMFVIAIGAMVAINNYYTRIFGKARPTDPTTMTWATAIVFSLFLVLVLFETYFMPPFSVLGFGVAVAFFAVGVYSKRYYYLAFGVLIAVAAFMPLFMNQSLGNPIFGSLGFVMLSITGVSVIIVGIIDHFYLLREARLRAGQGLPRMEEE